MRSSAFFQRSLDLLPPQIPYIKVTTRYVCHLSDVEWTRAVTENQYCDPSQFPRHTEVNISLMFNGIAYPVSPYDFNLGSVSLHSDCIGAVFSLDAAPSTTSPLSAAVDDPISNSTSVDPDWIVGDSFLKNVYTVFRYENPRAVGFAQLSSAALDLSNTQGAAFMTQAAAGSSAREIGTLAVTAALIVTVASTLYA